MSFFATLDPLMAVLLKEDSGNLRTYLKEARNQLYENAKPQESLYAIGLGVARGMAYLAELKVPLVGRLTLSTDCILKMGDHGMCGMLIYSAFLQPDILHRSLSAEHVLVSKDGVCKVTGFGFAEHVREREEYERTKRVGDSL